MRSPETVASRSWFAWGGFWLLAVIAGTLVGAIVIGLIEQIGMVVVPPPDGIKEAMEQKNLAKMNELIKSLPLASFLFVLLAWGCGALIGSATASCIGPRGSEPWPAMVVGTILWAMAMMMMCLIPHPLWMIIAGVVLFHPLAWLGQWLAWKMFSTVPHA